MIAKIKKAIEDFKTRVTARRTIREIGKELETIEFPLDRSTYNHAKDARSLEHYMSGVLSLMDAFKRLGESRGQEITEDLYDSLARFYGCFNQSSKPSERKVCPIFGVDMRVVANKLVRQALWDSSRDDAEKFRKYLAVRGS